MIRSTLKLLVVASSIFISPLITGALFAAPIDRPDYTGIPAEARGNTGVGGTEGADALFINPAGLASDSSGWDVGLHFSLGLNPVLLDYVDWALDNSAYINDVDELIARIEPIDTKWAPFQDYLGGHVRVGRWAFAWVTDLNYSVAIVQGPLSPVMGIGAKSDLTLISGYAQPVGRGFEVGGAVSATQMIRYPRRILGVLDEDFYGAMNALQDTTLTDYEKLQAITDVAKTSWTFGANMGLIKHLDSNWSLGLALIDAPVGNYLNTGVTWKRPLPKMGDIQSRFIFNTEFDRLFHPDVEWWRTPRLGAAFDANVNGRPVGYIATGFHDGYPTFGARLGYIFFISYTYYTEEQGELPGQDPLTFHKFSVDFHF